MYDLRCKMYEVRYKNPFAEMQGDFFWYIKGFQQLQKGYSNSFNLKAGDILMLRFVYLLIRYHQE